MLCRTCEPIGIWQVGLDSEVRLGDEEPSQLHKGQKSMAMFEGPDRTRNIMIIIGLAVVVLLVFLYATNRLPGTGGTTTPATTTTPAR